MQLSSLVEAGYGIDLHLLCILVEKNDISSSPSPGPSSKESSYTWLECASLGQTPGRHIFILEEAEISRELRLGSQGNASPRLAQRTCIVGE